MAMTSVTNTTLSPAEIIAEAHRRAVSTTPQDMARWMVNVFGRNLTAVITGVDAPTTVTRWTQGRTPHPANLLRLRAAFHIATLIALVDDDETARAWFTGMNPDLGDRSAALIIADEPERASEVMGAARSFLAHG